MGDHKTGNQLLLGINDQVAAIAMRLQAEERQEANGFLDWVKGHVDQGHPVAIGVYTNEYLFYGYTDPSAGDKQYDHIVPVLNVGSASITFSDNGLWSDSAPYYIFTYPISSFSATREQANNPNGSIYSLPSLSTYGIAITGISDENKETVPVRVTPNCNYEFPEIADKSNTRPSPMPLTLQITILNLEPGVDYILYRFNDFAKVPTSNFNAHAGDAVQHWPITSSAGTTYTLTDTTFSDTSAIYRCVKATAPQL